MAWIRFWGLLVKSLAAPPGQRPPPSHRAPNCAGRGIRISVIPVTLTHTVDDLAGADFLVAVEEAEHRPLMRERFGEWEHRADYWNVRDVEDVAPAEALPLLAQEVRTLLLSFG